MADLDRINMRRRQMYAINKQIKARNEETKVRKRCFEAEWKRRTTNNKRNRISREKKASKATQKM